MHWTDDALTMGQVRIFDLDKKVELFILKIYE